MVCLDFYTFFRLRWNNSVLYLLFWTVASKVGAYAPPAGIGAFCASKIEVKAKTKFANRSFSFLDFKLHLFLTLLKALVLKMLVDLFLFI